MSWVLAVVAGLVLVAVLVLLSYVPRPAGWPWWARVLAVAGGLAVAAGVVALVGLVPSMFYDYVPEAKDRAAAEATTRTGMLAGLAGLAALGTFWLNSRVYRVTARTFE